VLTYRLQRRRLYWRLPKRAVGAEVGVWKGNNAVRLLRWTRPKHLYLIDPWEHISDNGGAMYAKRPQAKMDAIYETVAERFADEPRVTVVRARSASFDKPLDWAYIDGDHTYEGVLSDLQTFWPLVSRCVAGDDYAIKGWWDDGVRRAVDEFAEREDCRLELFGSQFILRKVA
jgi:hypothetical protein